MKTILFVVCDAATEWCGKVNVLGTFDRINCVQIPAVHHACAVVGSLRFEAIEEGIHQFKVRFSDEDGREILPAMEGQIPIKVPPGAPYVTVNLVFNLQNVQFPKAGEYSIDLAVDGRIEASHPLFVQRIDPPPLAEAA